MQVDRRLQGIAQAVWLVFAQHDDLSSDLVRVRRVLVLSQKQPGHFVEHLVHHRVLWLLASHVDQERPVPDQNRVDDGEL